MIDYDCMFMKKAIIISVLALFAALAPAQEVLIDIAPSIIGDAAKTYFAEYESKALKNNDTLELPFFDDFSNSHVFPNQSFWIDHAAFMNNGYAKDPVSIGVASLDVIDSTGNVYTHLSYSASMVSEHLTSRPINLQYEASDSIYLSFYYQAGGYGNKPDAGDSLVLEFSTPDTSWISVWRVDGGTAMSHFELVLIPITQDYFLKKGFQFRFKNYASISSNYEPSWNSNFDVWNIDYVSLDTARNANDTVSQDVAFISNFQSMLKTYESIPWEHFKTVAADNTIDSLVYVYKNNGNTTQNINRQLIIRDVWGNGSGFSSLDDSENILPFSTLSYAKTVNYTFNSNTEDSAMFELKGFIKTDTTLARRPYRWNDTISYYQSFYNYYAYDDGSAEMGYGITGQGTAGSGIALRFETIKPDTLRGVNIFFNKVLDEANIKYFYLMVWGNNNGIPGDTLVEQIGVKPIYTDSLNQFHYYALDTPVFVSGTFYIGWIKTTDDMLNVGFDKNRNASQHLLYNIGGTWESSALQGSIMVRPVFGKDPNPLSIPQSIQSAEYKLYPNPARDLIFIDSKNSSSAEAYQIFDYTGRMWQQGEHHGSINISSLQPGMYFLRLNGGIHTYTLRFSVAD